MAKLLIDFAFTSNPGTGRLGRKLIYQQHWQVHSDEVTSVVQAMQETVSLLRTEDTFFLSDVVMTDLDNCW